MDSKLFLSAISLLIGSAITLITTYFNNRNQLERERIKGENDYNRELKKIELEHLKKQNVEQLNTIKRISLHLYALENMISLTSSVIQSDKKLTIQEFDDLYKLELKDLIELESLVLTDFPELSHKIDRLAGLHNQYWGDQRILLTTDIKENKERFSSLQRKIIEIQNESNSIISDFKDTVKTISKELYS